MAFSYIFEANSETGTITDDWDSEDDTDGQLDVAHYTELARFPWPTCVPYRGAYCLRATLSGDTSEATVQGNDINIADTINRFFRFAIWLSPTFTGTADDTINIFELQDTSDVVEATFGLRYVNSTGVINFGIGETAPTSWSTGEIARGVWYTVELDVTVDSAAGTIDLYVTKDGDPASTTVAATQVSGLAQGAVTHGVLGVQDHLSTTTGVILLDEIVMDDARVYPKSRFPTSINFTKSGHAFIGPGSISSAALLTDEASNVMRLWDTDTGNTNEQDGYVIDMDVDNQTRFLGPFTFNKGCYVQLSGTDPRGEVIIEQANDLGGQLGPLCYSVAGVRNWADV